MTENDAKDIKEDIHSAFAATASSMGYDEVHGRIIAALTVNEGPLSLQELADETGYSSSSVSLSLELLEVFGIIKRVKKQGDRKLYVRLDGDLLEGLKHAVLIRIQKNIAETLSNFEEYKERLENMNSKEADKVLEGLSNLKKQIERLEKYVDRLAEVEIPEEEK